jgi:uncharacterized Fe-S cluster-containing MiaB family protein
LLAKGQQVWIAKPQEVGKDYNDILREHGIAAVKTHIENAISYTNYHDQRSTTKTLKSEVLNKLDEISSKLPFDPATAGQFIQRENETLKFTERELEKVTQSTQNLERILIERASEFVTVGGSVSQQDINRYLHTSIDSIRKVNDVPSQARTSIQPELNKVKVKENELELCVMLHAN